MSVDFAYESRVLSFAKVSGVEHEGERPQRIAANNWGEAKCVACLQVYTRTRPGQKYCSKSCCKDAHFQRHPRQTDFVNRTMVGAASELSVSADLLRRGYHVFRAVSPDAPCDLIALKGGVPKRVQVKTDNRTIVGDYQPIGSPKEEGRYDIYACVRHNGVYYFDSNLEPIDL